MVEFKEVGTMLGVWLGIGLGCLDSSTTVGILSVGKVVGTSVGDIVGTSVGGIEELDSDDAELGEAEGAGGGAGSTKNTKSSASEYCSS